MLKIKFFKKLILQLDKKFAKAEEAFENYLKILSTPQSNYF
jgi:hypothetical protein